jgi:uncharacterized protein
MTLKQQVLVIHGGDTFERHKEYIAFLKNFKIDLDKFRKKDWKDNLQKDLGKNYDVICPQMPNKFNARYEEWKIWFEKILDLLEDNLILIGHSLGGIFLTKYLSENRINKKIKATILVAAVFDETNEFLTNFKLSKSLDKFLNQSEEIYLMHSLDDQVVPFRAMGRYKKLLPKAEEIVFKNKGHFNQEKFSEIVELIKKI